MSSDVSQNHESPAESPAPEVATDAATQEPTPTAEATAETPAAEAQTAVAVAEQPAAAEEASAEPEQAAAPAADAPAESQPAEAAGAGVQAEPQATEAERPRVQLNPAGGEQLKAVPNPVTEGAAPEATESGEGEAPVSDSDIEAAAADLAGAVQDVVEVAIPKDVELGDLEAEIEAAMVGDAQAAEAAPEAASGAQELPEQGARLEGVIQSVHGDDVFFDLGFRIPGIVQMRQFEGIDPPEVGKKLKVVVSKVDENEGLIALNLPTGRSRPGGNWDAVEKGQTVDCTVQKTNKGGLEVMVGSLRGFMPASQVDTAFVGDLSAYVGQKLQAQITEVNPQKRNLVLSRRALLIEERKAQEAEFWETLEEGAEYDGRVKTIKDYGAFVDLGGADGFLHIGQISWTHIKHPNEVLSEGQSIRVKVTKIDREKNRIGLGMKELTQNPWDAAETTYAPETVHTGKVSRVMDFGAFVELEPGIEGLIHISQLDWKRVRKVTDVVQEGKEVTAKVLEFDKNRKRIALSVKAMSEDPRIAEEEAREAELAKRPPIERRTDLRGGIGQPESGGGLFGNPSDFS